jgi:hypothetical protein
MPFRKQPFTTGQVGYTLVREVVMALKFVEIPRLEWKKIKLEKKNEEPHTIEVLCVCIKIENTGDTDQETSISFRGYIPNTSVPPGPDYEEPFCEHVKVKIPKHTTVENCCCYNTRGLYGIVTWKGWVVVDGEGLERNASTHGTALKIPDPPKPKSE